MDIVLTHPTPVKIKPAFNTMASPPVLPASVLRSTADPFILDGEAPPAWQPPATMPDLADIERSVRELARTLKDPTMPHLAWCLKKLSVLPTRAADKLEWAFWTDNFYDTSGDIPDDIWTSTTTELLRTKTFRPSPNEFEAIARPEFEHRKRRLKRAQSMMASIKTNKRMESKEEPKPVDPKDKLREIIARGFKFKDTVVGSTLMKDARSAERDLAVLESRPPEAWAHDREPAAKDIGAIQAEYRSLPMSAENKAGLLRSSARFHRSHGRVDHAVSLFAEAQTLYPLDEHGRPMPTLATYGLD